MLLLSEKSIMNPQMSQALQRMATNYLKYVKYTSVFGAVVGTTVSFGVMSDIDRPLLNTEKLVYPLAGCIGGAFFFTTAPVWILFGPVVYVLGPDAAGKAASGLLAAVLLNGTDDTGNGGKSAKNNRMQ